MYYDVDINKTGFFYHTSVTRVIRKVQTYIVYYKYQFRRMFTLYYVPDWLFGVLLVYIYIYVTST
jgi:hypothetical protein